MRLSLSSLLLLLAGCASLRDDAAGVRVDPGELNAIKVTVQQLQDAQRDDLSYAEGGALGALVAAVYPLIIRPLRRRMNGTK